MCVILLLLLPPLSGPRTLGALAVDSTEGNYSYLGGSKRAPFSSCKSVRRNNTHLDGQSWDVRCELATLITLGKQGTQKLQRQPTVSLYSHRSRGSICSSHTQCHTPVRRGGSGGHELRNKGAYWKGGGPSGLRPLRERERCHTWSARLGSGWRHKSQRGHGWRVEADGRDGWREVLGSLVPFPLSTIHGPYPCFFSPVIFFKRC